MRNKILSLFREIYSEIGNKMWNMIDISEKDQKFLEDNLFIENEEENEEEDELFTNEEQENFKKDKRKNEKVIISNKNEIKEKNSNNNEIILLNKKKPLNKEDLLALLDKLFSKDLSEKINAIIIIHEITCGEYYENKEFLITNIDLIITIFKNLLQQLSCVKDLKSIPMKFTKYFTITLCKLSSNRELISNISYEVSLALSRELLKCLLIKDLETIGDNKEGIIIFKSINSTMLRILENCNKTQLTLALLEIIKEFYEKDDKNLLTLAIKCLLKLLNNFTESMDKIDQILLKIHLLLLNLEEINSNINTRNLIINTMKEIVRELVVIEKENIMEDYSKSVLIHTSDDKYILKWINMDRNADKPAKKQNTQIKNEKKPTPQEIMEATEALRRLKQKINLEKSVKK